MFKPETKAQSKSIHANAHSQDYPFRKKIKDQKMAFHNTCYFTKIFSGIIGTSPII